MEEENQNSFLDNRSFSLFLHFFYNLWKGMLQILVSEEV